MDAFLTIFRSKIRTAIALLVFLLLFGVVGFKIVSGLSWLDAFYMTVITITTVGFREVGPLDDFSKIFTIVLILASVIIVGYAISIITEYILSKNNFEDKRLKKMQKKIDEFQNHIIVCGYGRNGEQAVKKLTAYQKPFVVIEKDKDKEDKLLHDSVPYIIGNANEDEVLFLAGIDRAESLICALPNDADNLYVVLSARQINGNLKIISRATQDASYKKLKLAGADDVILPDKIGGEHMASLVVEPDLIEFIENISIIGKSTMNIEEISIDKLYDSGTVKTIKDLDLRNKSGCTVIGFKNQNGEYIVNPEADTSLVPNSKIIVLGRPEQIEQLHNIYDIA